MEFPVPLPTTPYSSNVVPLTGEDYMNARKGVGHPAVLQVFQEFGAFTIKPKKNSKGVIWNGRAYWWSAKGYYRTGKANGERRPLQHLVWSHHHRRPFPAGHEIFFKDRNRNNFDPANLELLSKAEMHKRISEIGEKNQPTHEQRKEIASKRWTRHARNITSLLLKNHQEKETNEHSNKIQFIANRRQIINHGPKRDS